MPFKYAQPNDTRLLLINQTKLAPYIPALKRRGFTAAFDKRRLGELRRVLCPDYCPDRLPVAGFLDVGQLVSVDYPNFQDFRRVSRKLSENLVSPS